MKLVGYGIYSVELVNVDWQPIDISLRAQISGNPDEVRIELQKNMSKQLDYRYWKVGQKVEWDNLFVIAKNNNKISYIPDQFFYPNSDISVNKLKFPRIRGFRLLDLDGNLISDSNGNLNPFFYPNQADFSFINTVL